jgi:hypothetical protein
MSGPDPTVRQLMQTLAEAGAAQIAKRTLESMREGGWRSVRVDGPIYREIVRAAVPAILGTLEQLQYALEKRLRAKAAPQDEKAGR